MLLTDSLLCLRVQGLGKTVQVRIACQVADSAACVVLCAVRWIVHSLPARGGLQLAVRVRVCTALSFFCCLTTRRGARMGTASCRPLQVMGDSLMTET